jgi:hypothetical protein
VQFYYLCAQNYSEQARISHCQSHLKSLQPRCGMLTFRYTLVAPGFCPFCLGDEDKKPDERFQQWVAKATLLNDIDRHCDGLKTSTTFFCPHPCCRAKDYGSIINLRRHFFDAHSIDETRSNCVNRKRNWQTEPQLAPKDNTQAHPEDSAIQNFSMLRILTRKRKRSVPTRCKLQRNSWSSLRVMMKARLIMKA